MVYRKALSYVRAARTAYGLAKPVWRAVKSHYKGRYLRRTGRTYLRRGKRSYSKRIPERFDRRQIGARPNSSSSKSVSVDVQNVTSRDSRVMYVTNLTQITQGGNRNQRERNIITCTGFKLHFQFINLATQAMYLHVAILANKQDDDASSTANFFRSPSDTRAEDFGVALSGLSMHALPINTDKFVVLKHMKSTIVGSSQNSTWQANSGKNFRTYKMWIPLRRQLRFEQNTDTTPYTGNVWLYWWCTRFDDDSGQAVRVGDCQAGHRYEMYFREPRSG